MTFLALPLETHLRTHATGAASLSYLDHIARCERGSCMSKVSSEKRYQGGGHMVDPSPLNYEGEQ